MFLKEFVRTLNLAAAPKAKFDMTKNGTCIWCIWEGIYHSVELRPSHILWLEYMLDNILYQIIAYFLPLPFPWNTWAYSPGFWAPICIVYILLSISTVLHIWKTPFGGDTCSVATFLFKLASSFSCPKCCHWSPPNSYQFLTLRFVFPLYRATQINNCFYTYPCILICIDSTCFCTGSFSLYSLG